MSIGTSDYLDDEIKDKLQPYQIDSLNRKIIDYMHQNEEADQAI